MDMKIDNVSSVVSDLEMKYGDVWHIPDTDPMIIKIRYWFDPTGRNQLNLHKPNDDKITKLYQQGLTDKQIADQLSRSKQTVARDRRRLGLGAANGSVTIYTLTDLDNGKSAEFKSLKAVGNRVGSKTESYSFLKKYANKRGYKLERITK